MVLAGRVLQIQMETRHGFLQTVSVGIVTRTQMETLNVKHQTVSVVQELLTQMGTRRALPLTGLVAPALQARMEM